MTPQEELLAAADDIERHGLNKKTFFQSREGEWHATPACSLGALARVTGHVASDGWIFGENSVWLHAGEAPKLLASHIRSKFPDVASTAGPDSWDVISVFNDRETTTAEDVVRVMREAAQ